MGWKYSGNKLGVSAADGLVLLSNEHVATSAGTCNLPILSAILELQAATD